MTRRTAKQSLLFDRMERLDAELQGLSDMFTSRLLAINFRLEQIAKRLPKAEEVRMLRASVQELRMVVGALEERVSLRQGGSRDHKFRHEESNS